MATDKLFYSNWSYGHYLKDRPYLPKHKELIEIEPKVIKSFPSKEASVGDFRAWLLDLTFHPEWHWRDGYECNGTATEIFFIQSFGWDGKSVRELTKEQMEKDVAEFGDDMDEREVRRFVFDIRSIMYANVSCYS